MNKKICLLCFVLCLFLVGCIGQYGSEPAMTENEANVLFEQIAKQSEQLARIESEMTTPVRITNVQGSSTEKQMEFKQTASDIIGALKSVENPDVRLILISKAISMEPGNVDFYDMYETECENLYSSLEALNATVLLITENLQYVNDAEMEPMLQKIEEFNEEYTILSQEIYDERQMKFKQTASDIMDGLKSVEDPEIRLLIISKAIAMEPGNIDFYDIYEKECETLYSPLEALESTVLLIAENLQYVFDSEWEAMTKKAEEFNAEYNRISKENYESAQNDIKEKLNAIVAEIKNHASDKNVDIDLLFTLVNDFDDTFVTLDEPSDDMVSISDDIDVLVAIILEYLDITEFAESSSTMDAVDFSVSYKEVSSEIESMLEDIGSFSVKNDDIGILVEYFRTSIVDIVDKIETRYKNVDAAIQEKSISSINSINKVLNTHKTLNLDTLSIQLNQLSDAFNGISEYDQTLESLYAEYMYLCSAYESYLDVSKLSGNAMNMTDDDFFQYYINISVMVDNAGNTLLLRPQGMKNYSTVLDNIFNSIKASQRKLYNRYETLALRKIDQLIKDYKSAGGKGAALSKASALIGTLEINESTEKRNADIRKTSSDLYKESFSNFQYEMGKQLAGIKNVVDAAKKNERLELMFKYGFFDIPYDDLIPELKVIYDSFDVQKAIEDSSKTFHELLWKYPVIYHEVMDY